jgi:PhzF family phenazine biosynthesis protein
MSELAYWVVDAFTDRIFAGNPAAVVLPEAALPDRLMQQIAAENNLSETAFAVPEGDGYRLRWSRWIFAAMPRWLPASF